MSLFPGIPDDVFDCHLYPILGALIRLNRDLDAHYRANIRRSLQLHQDALRHPLLALSPTCGPTVARIVVEFEHIVAVIFYGINLRDIATLNAVADNPNFHPSAICSELVFAALAGGNDLTTRFCVYHYLRRHGDIKLESGTLMHTQRYDAIKPSDFAKLVIRFLNLPGIVKLRYSNFGYTNDMILKYIYRLIDAGDKYLITILSGLRSEYYTRYYEIIYYAARAQRRDIVISLVISRRHHLDQETMTMLIHWGYYRLLQRLTRREVRDAGDIAVLVGRNDALDWIVANHSDYRSPYTRDDAMLPIRQRAAKVSEIIQQQSRYSTAIKVVAIYLDIPEIYEDGPSWYISDNLIPFIDMCGNVAKYIYATNKASMMFRFAYQATHNLPRDDPFNSKALRGWVVMMEHILAALKYCNEDLCVEQLKTKITQTSLTLYNRTTISKLIVKRAFARLYDIVDSTCWAHALVYAHRYGNLDAATYFRKKIRRYNDNPFGNYNLVLDYTHIITFGEFSSD